MLSSGGSQGPHYPPVGSLPTEAMAHITHLVILEVDHFQEVVVLQTLEATDLIVGQIHLLQGFQFLQTHDGLNLVVALKWIKHNLHIWTRASNSSKTKQ